MLIAAEEDVAPALRDHWQDVCTAFHDDDAGHLYVNPDAIQAQLDARARIRLSSISGDQPIELRAQTADTAARNLKEAETELEKLVRSGYRTVVTWSTTAEGERAAYNLSAPEGDVGVRRQAAVPHARGCATASSPRASSSPSCPTTGCCAAAAPSAPAAWTRAGGAAARCARSPTCAPATSSSTRTTASRASPASTRRPSPASPATT